MKKKFVLFGAGKNGMRILRLLGNDQVACFCDNYQKTLTVEGIPVIDVSRLKEIFQNYIVVLTTLREKDTHEVSVQLASLEIPFILSSEIEQANFENDLGEYSAQNKRKTFAYNEKYKYPIMTDKMAAAGSLGSYFWQDLWAAQHIHQEHPAIHCDIGSRVDGFIAHLLAFGQKIQLFDIRALESTIPGVQFVQCDATNLDNIADGSIQSLSALCSLEHFGLGRYGDPIDPEACFKCFTAIQRKMQPGGYVYISVPIGQEHLEYNAHRVFYAKTIVDAFSGMELKEFSSTKNAKIEYNIDLHTYDHCLEHGGERFGLFMFEKK